LRLALVVCGGLLAIKGWLLLRVGVDLGFGVMHVLWLDLVIALPVRALLVLVLAGRRLGHPLRLVGLAVCLHCRSAISPTRSGRSPARAGARSSSALSSCRHPGSIKLA
jgi:hypothetical protein